MTVTLIVECRGVTQSAEVEVDVEGSAHIPEPVVGVSDFDRLMVVASGASFFSQDGKNIAVYQGIAETMQQTLPAVQLLAAMKGAINALTK